MNPISTVWPNREEFDPTGKVITGVWINQDRTVIKFAFSDGTSASLATGADCCSETWIEHVSDFDYAIVTGKQIGRASCRERV